MEKETFIKKYWEEENVWFCIAFKGEFAEKQLEIHCSDYFKTSTEIPFDRESMLYDQKLSELDLEEEDFILKEEFEKIWNKY